MKLGNLPFNISLLNPDAKTFRGMFPVVSLALYDGNGNDFHPQGLYSSIIFGKQGEKRRFDTASYIDMKTYVFSPMYFKELKRLKSLYAEILLGKAYAVFDEDIKDFVRASVIDGETGYDFFLRHWDKLEFARSKSITRNQRIELLTKFKDRALIRYHTVIPAGLRDVDFDDNGRPVEDDLNGLYRKLLSQSSVLSAALAEESSKVNDQARASLTASMQLIYEHIFGLLGGKRGMLQAKFGSRRIFGTTRNVISSMEVGGSLLGDPRQPTQDTTQVGLTQYIAGSLPYFRYHLRNTILPGFFDNVGGTVSLVNPDTLKAESHVLKDKTRDKWGTDDGLNALAGSFLEPHLRHKPVLIDGKFLSLIYRDDKGFKLLNSIDELPDHLDKEKVRAITWAELFYLTSAQSYKRARGFCTRYPVTGTGSIYACRIYLRTTVRALQLKPYTEDWSSLEDEVYLEFPDTDNKLAFVETMVVHPSVLPLIGGDFDGDTMSLNMVFSDESIIEVDERLNDISLYVDATGGLTYSSTTDVTEWVLRSLTHPMA